MTCRGKRANADQNGRGTSGTRKAFPLLRKHCLADPAGGYPFLLFLGKYSFTAKSLYFLLLTLSNKTEIVLQLCSTVLNSISHDVAAGKSGAKLYFPQCQTLRFVIPRGFDLTSLSPAASCGCVERWRTA
jgi:hypothetical protein